MRDSEGANEKVMPFDLRPATDKDYELLWKIQRTTIGPYVDVTFRTSETEQRKFFDERFDHRKHQIILVGGVDAGFLSFEIRGDHIFLGNIALLPPFQRKGIGEEVVRYVVAKANAEGLPVRLQVLKSNPARRFYERLGFVMCGETETHFQMLRRLEVL